MSVALQHNVGAQVAGNFANCQQDASGDPVLLTAGATEDGVKVTGGTIDRLGFLSAQLTIAGKAVLAQDETISFAVEYQDSADGASWNTAVEMQASTAAATGGTGGTTEEFAVDLDLDLGTLDRYVRFNVTPTMSAVATDTAVWGAGAQLGGQDVKPS